MFSGLFGAGRPHPRAGKPAANGQAYTSSHRAEPGRAASRTIEAEPHTSIPEIAHRTERSLDSGIKRRLALGFASNWVRKMAGTVILLIQIRFLRFWDI